jgi:hypothetical protein
MSIAFKDDALRELTRQLISMDAPETVVEHIRNTSAPFYNDYPYHLECIMMYVRLLALRDGDMENRMKQIQRLKNQFELQRNVLKGRLQAVRYLVLLHDLNIAETNETVFYTPKKMVFRTAYDRNLVIERG